MCRVECLFSSQLAPVPIYCLVTRGTCVWTTCPRLNVKCRGWESNLRPLGCRSDALTTTLPRHTTLRYHCLRWRNIGTKNVTSYRALVAAGAAYTSRCATRQLQRDGAARLSRRDVTHFVTMWLDLWPLILYSLVGEVSWWTIAVPSLAILVSAVLVLSCGQTDTQTDRQTESRMRMIAILNVGKYEYIYTRRNYVTLQRIKYNRAGHNVSKLNFAKRLKMVEILWSGTRTRSPLKSSRPSLVPKPTYTSKSVMKIIRNFWVILLTEKQKNKYELLCVSI